MAEARRWPSSLEQRRFFLKFATGDPAPTGRVSNMLKDLDTALELGHRSNTPLPVTAAATEVNRWLVAKGYGAADNAALVAFYDDLLDDGRWSG